MSITEKAINALAIEIATWAENKGFWDRPSVVQDALETAPSSGASEWIMKLEKTQKLMLVVTELAEGVEGLRKNADSSLAGFSNEEEEVADAIIRLLDYAGHYNLRIGEAILAKMEFNEGREHRHGKAF